MLFMKEVIIEQAESRADFLESAVDQDAEPEHDLMRLGPYERFDRLRQRLDTFTSADPDVPPQQATSPTVPIANLEGHLNQLSLRFRLIYGLDDLSPKSVIKTLDSAISPSTRRPYWKPIWVGAEWLLHPSSTNPDEILDTPRTPSEILNHGEIFKVIGVSLMQVADPAIPGLALPGAENDLSSLESSLENYEQALQATS
jgi:hypothetical protein